MIRKLNDYSRRSFVKAVSALTIAPFTVVASAGNHQVVSNSKRHRVLTANIRVALEEDAAKGFGWGDRKKICIDVLKDQQADIICFQEVLGVQNEDLKAAMPDYFSFGFEGPEMDAHKTGYHGVAKNPIFFSTRRYALISAGTYWLSETPHIGGSKSWDTARARHVNWVRLREKKSGVTFRVLSLHLDHVSQYAREKQTEMMLAETAQYPGDFIQILAGDFNASAANTVIKMVKENGWTDSYTEVHGDKEPGFTVHSFLGEQHPKKDERKKIDFILTKGNVRSHSASIIKDHRDGKYPSDHYFVLAEIELNP